MDFSMLSHDIMEQIWNEKVKIEKLEKAEKSAKKGFPLVIKELKKVSMKDTDIIDTEENYNEYGMGEGSNIYAECADELNLPDSQYTEEEEDAMIASYIEEKNIVPIINNDRYNNPFIEYFQIFMNDKILKRIKKNRRVLARKIREAKQWDFQTDKHIFSILSVIRDRGYTDAPLEDRFYFLRPTAQYGFGGHMNTDIEGFGTMIYREQIDAEAQGGFLEYNGIYPEDFNNDIITAPLQ